MRSPLRVLIGAALLALGVPAHAQPAQRGTAPTPPRVPMTQVGRDIIRIDARVTDREGRSIADLKPEDFLIELDGRKQVIDSASAFTWDLAPQAASFIFVVDDLHLSYTGLFLAKDVVRSFIGRWNPAVDLVAIRRTSDEPGNVILSRSPTRFAEAIDLIPMEGLSRKETPRQPMRPTGAFPDEADLDISPMKVEYRVVAGEPVRVDTSPISIPQALPPSETQRRIYCLLSTIQGMKSLPGRKALVLVGEDLLSQEGQRMDELSVSTPFDALIDRQAEASALRTIVEVANRASVVIYTIDPSGLVSDLSGAVPQGSTEAQRLAAAESRARAQRSLRRLAEETGGIAVFDRNDLKSGLDQIVTDQRFGYVVGFKPPQSTFAKASGKASFHHLKLVVNRPDAVVRTRSGFFGVTDREVETRNR